MRTIMTALSLIFIFSLLACDEDAKSQQEKNCEAKIKRKLFYNYIEDTIPIMIFEYQYDNEMKLERIDHYLGNCPDTAYGHELFEYNLNNEIVNKYTYHYVSDSLG